MIIVRDATEEDLPQILEIYNDIIVNTTAVYDYHPHTLAMRKEWFETRKAEGYPIFVAEENKTIVGFSTIGSFRKWAAYKYAVENSVYVASSYRGRGLGKLLLEPLITASKALNKHCILAGIDASNDASIALHKTYGFIEVAHFKEVGYKFGKWLDLKFLQLTLETPAAPVEM
jgi:phosphinothricin acetyltransferase